MADLYPIKVTVNGKPHQCSVQPRTHLVDFLREDLGLKGSHLGCEHGVCGACTVELDGKIVRGCLTLAVQADGAQVQTIEGLSATGVSFESAVSASAAMPCSAAFVRRAC